MLSLSRCPLFRRTLTIPLALLLYACAGTDGNSAHRHTAPQTAAPAVATDCARSEYAAVLSPLLKGYELDPDGALLLIPSADRMLIAGDRQFAGQELIGYMAALTELASSIEAYSAVALSRDLHCAGVPAQQAVRIAYLYNQVESLQRAAPAIAARFQQLREAERQQQHWRTLQQRYAAQLTATQGSHQVRLDNLYLRRVDERELTLLRLAMNPAELPAGATLWLESSGGEQAVERQPALQWRRLSGPQATESSWIASFAGWPASTGADPVLVLATQHGPLLRLPLPRELLADPALQLNY